VVGDDGRPGLGNTACSGLYHPRKSPSQSSTLLQLVALKHHAPQRRRR
jgi:hypothetical protein